jgi:hypothetical protein
LDRQFPPASLTAASTDDQLRAYWRAACPKAPERIQHLAAQLTRDVLTLAPDAAVGNWAAGGWTTILAANGVVLAAIDAKTNTVRLDFLLPEDLAQHYRDLGLIRLHHPRRYGRWCLTEVDNPLPYQTARDLLATGIEFERNGARRSTPGQ